MLHVFGQGGRTSLLVVGNVEHEMHNVAVLHDVISPFLTVAASSFYIRLQTMPRNDGKR